MKGKDGREAVVLAGRERPDLNLLDYHMPLTNGFHAARVISSGEATREVLIIAIMAFGSQETRRLAQAALLANTASKPA